jgi:hypothetical protein
MRYRFPAFLAAAALVAAAPAGAQTASRAKTAKAWTPPRTPDGRPDLQGVWSNASLTPFERPRDLAEKEFFTPEEAATFVRKAIAAANRDRRGATPEEDVGLAYNELFFERGTNLSPNLRTSVVVDPPDGRVPALTPEARQAADLRAAAGRRRPERAQDFGLAERCLLWSTSGPPMVPGPYNNNYQIVQTRDHIAIDVEMAHDVRMIPLDGRSHASPAVRLWMGDSVGRWDGDTLVVDTTNFSDKTHFRGSDRNLHVTERFTRTGPETLEYRFTIDDPTAFTKPWTGEIVMTRTTGPLYEYACHEGNYALTNMLQGARAADQAEAAKKPE